MKLWFSTKAGTLKALSKIKLKYAYTLPVVLITIKEYILSSDKVYNRIKKELDCETLAIRSSCVDEDNFIFSNAGKFTSVLSVPINDKNKVHGAIKEVIHSYKNKNQKNEVLIQPMLENIKCAGVAFTADFDNLAPYYIINYDLSGTSDNITSGRGDTDILYIHYKYSSIKPKNDTVNTVIKALKELEKIFDTPFLDVEFAITESHRLYILQVRPIAGIDKKRKKINHKNISSMLEKIHSKIHLLNKKHPNLFGEKAMFGIMPDWNPAEIIGYKPRKLALSLYKELITDNIWAYQRDNYGYRRLRSHPLLISFLGIPFIDIRVDFNSFIPKKLHDKIAEKLVNFYLSQLDEHPNFHDKIEFNIIFSCYHLTIHSELKKLINLGFSDTEIKRIEFSLLEITNQIINPHTGLYKQDLNKIEILKNKYDEIVNSNLSIIDKIYWLTEDCKRYGTLPFAGIARAAFIAVQFLHSFVATGIISDDEYNFFMNSLNTLPKQLSGDLEELKRGLISKTDFLSKYGHLRPGTYDILSPRYDEAFEQYFSNTKEEFIDKKSFVNKSKFSFSANQLKKLDNLLIENGIDISAEELLMFIKESIEGREYAKFIFTRSLSEILRLIEKLGQELDISKEELSHLDFKELLKLYAEVEAISIDKILKNNIDINKKAYTYTELIKLPPLIRAPDDVYSFFIQTETPNFITAKRIVADVVKEDAINILSLKNKIVLITSADPGYDFLFTKNIAGLITCFGGANSHMAVRCAELGIPAVIGAGQKNFNLWSRFSRLCLDCATKTVEGIYENA